MSSRSPARSALDGARTVVAGPEARGRDEVTVLDPAVVPRADRASHRRLAGIRAAWPLRRLVVVAALMPVLIASLLAAGRGSNPATGPVWIALVALAAVICAATVATYVPLPGTGFRLEVGCTPCAAGAALSVLACFVVVASAPPGPLSALFAVGIASFGLRQRLTAPSACPA
jgi:hypothetical protein